MKKRLLLACLFMLFSFEGGSYFPVIAQRSSQASIYFAPYHINGTTPGDFAEFFYFDVFEHPGDKKATGKFVRVKGTVHSRDGSKYWFSSARLERDEVGILKLAFKTSQIEGVEYSFEGTLS